MGSIFKFQNLVEVIFVILLMGAAHCHMQDASAAESPASSQPSQTNWQQQPQQRPVTRNNVQRWRVVGFIKF